MVTVDPTQLLGELNMFLTQRGPATTIQVVNNMIAMLKGDPLNAVLVQTLESFVATIKI